MSRKSPSNQNLRRSQRLPAQPKLDRQSLEPPKGTEGIYGAESALSRQRGSKIAGSAAGKDLTSTTRKPGQSNPWPTGTSSRLAFRVAAISAFSRR